MYNGKSAQSIEISEKVDIYALGLILLELSTNITTTHEKQTTFKLVKEIRKLPSTFSGVSLEGELILRLTEKDPQCRPSAQLIKDKWLPRWKEELFSLD